ncbi:MAG: alpha/beta hydrolase [Flavobacteriaceae bacterium]|tara:strand:- start:1073 stop:2005 length:933 start_codon:yes stop_codon:yes gene_type:complete
MKKNFKIFLYVLMTTIHAYAQEFTSEEIKVNTNVEGTLLLPNTQEEKSIPLVILIAGSGPTDRDGNQSFMKNDALKKIAEALSQKGIATFRYDKRIVKQIRNQNIDKNISFDDFVIDARSVIGFFKSKFETIIVAGHSQGSLVGLLALDAGASGFISLAGAGKPIDEILEEQIVKTAAVFSKSTERVLNVLRSGETTSEYPPELASIFNLELQAFLISWMQHNPAKIIANTPLPILIINGDKDLQVDVKEAQLLNSAAQNSKLIIIEHMNHVLVKIDGDDLENAKSYNNPNLKINEELINAIQEFTLAID